MTCYYAIDPTQRRNIRFWFDSLVSDYLELKIALELSHDVGKRVYELGFNGPNAETILMDFLDEWGIPLVEVSVEDIPKEAQ